YYLKNLQLNINNNNNVHNSPQIPPRDALLWPGISPLASRREVQDLIAGGLGVKGVEVTGQGNCYGFSWYIEWTEHPGRKTLAKVNDEDLVFDGDSLSLGIRRVAEGKILHSPLSLDFLTVRRTEPYVAVTVYRYPAGCSSDCSFTYNNDQALYLTMVNGTPGLPGEHTLTISGEGNASTVADDYHIMVGDSFCSIVSLNASQPVGAALHSNPSVTSNYSVSISLTSLSPSSGGTGGGYPVVVSGSGLPSTTSGWRDHVITINGNQCTVTAASVVSVTCIAPPGVEGVAEVNVVVGGKNATLEEGFTYVLNASPSLTSVTPTTSSVLGKSGEAGNGM
ncbi:Fibrocystin-L-like 5, partial [Homarus americanus]